MYNMSEENALKQWRVVRKYDVQEEFWVFSGNDRICNCGDDTEIAEQIAQEHNSHAGLLAAIAKTEGRE